MAEDFPAPRDRQCRVTENFLARSPSPDDDAAGNACPGPAQRAAGLHRRERRARRGNFHVSYRDRLLPGRAPPGRREGGVRLDHRRRRQAFARAVGHPRQSPQRRPSTPDDRGLLDVAVDPDFNNNLFIYLLYTVDPDTNNTEPATEYLLRPPRPLPDDQRHLQYDQHGQPRGSLRAHLAGGTDQHLPDPHDRVAALGADGSLLVSAGEGAAYTFTDAGGNQPTAFGPRKTSLTEDVGAFRAQYPGSWRARSCASIHRPAWAIRAIPSGTATPARSRRGSGHTDSGTRSASACAPERAAPIRPAATRGRSTSVTWAWRTGKS